MRSIPILALALLPACETLRPLPEPLPPVGPGQPDVHSYARPEQVRVTHVDLDLSLDFRAQVVRGRARVDFDRIDPSAPLVLDTKDLTVDWVEGPDGGARPFALADSHPLLGAPLAISLDKRDASVTVHYTTSPEADALQWLAPTMTSSGAHPYLYTQGQAILTRSWIPLQDSPAVRITYGARVTAPSALTVVMSTMERGRDADGTWTFDMPKAVPPYLIALACGEIERRELSDRVAIYAEPAVVDEAAAEFEDTPAMLAGCEELYGPYRWGRYDILVLPPAFPFGGMENPCLTFATPTILAGDKSLVALVAHELAHSWSGNLVTNATWRDFWLNEGFTVYLEKRIMEHVFGPERARMEILNDLRGLVQELRELPREDQVLHLELAGRNPDDAMTAVAYEKGATFLRTLEETFGRDRFDAFLAEYFDHFAFQSITTDTFRTYLRQHLLEPAGELADAIDIEQWIEQPGLPEGYPTPVSNALGAVDSIRSEVLAGDPDAVAEAKGWNTQQWLHFLADLPTDQGPDLYAALDGSFGLTGKRNAEILSAWLVKAVLSGYEPAYERQEQFLMSVGRRKFLTPQYKALLDSGQDARAALIYQNARPRYHSVATQTLDALLGYRAQ